MADPALKGFGLETHIETQPALKGFGLETHIETQPALLGFGIETHGTVGDGGRRGLSTRRSHIILGIR